MKQPHAIPALLLLIAVLAFVFAYAGWIQLQMYKHETGGPMEPTIEQESDVRALAEAAQRHARVLQAGITRLVQHFQDTTGLCVEAVEVTNTEITRMGRRELLPRVGVKVAL